MTDRVVAGYDISRELLLAALMWNSNQGNAVQIFKEDIDAMIAEFGPEGYVEITQDESGGFVTLIMKRGPK